MSRLSIIAAEPPSAAPEFVGQHYVNTAAGTVYHAVGTSAVGDWREGGAGGSSNGATVVPLVPVDGAVTIDPTQGDFFAMPATQNTSITIGAVPTTGHWSFRLRVDDAGLSSAPGWTITWLEPDYFVRKAFEADASTVGSWVIYEVFTLNGGDDWYVRIVAKWDYPAL